MYVDLDGVRTWYDEHGAGEPLVLLHPAMTDARAFAPNVGALAQGFRVLTPERRGHGRTPDVEGPYESGRMAADTTAFVELVARGPAHLVGCSTGATVALLATLHRPELVRRLVLVAGVFHRDGWAPGVLDETPPDFMADSYGEISPDGRDHFAVVAEKLARWHDHQPALTDEDLARVENRTLVMVADDDEVTLEHAVELYRGIRDAELAIVPGTSHGLLVEKPELCNGMIVDFLSNDPVPTFAPIRRAG